MLSEYLAYRFGRSVERGQHCPPRSLPQPFWYYGLRKAVGLLTLALVLVLLIAGLLL